jgi:hypothetical protein
MTATCRKCSKKLGRNTSKYCRACWRLSRITSLECACENCGKKIKVIKSRKEKHSSLFCSPVCLTMFRQSPPRKCQQCGVVFKKPPTGKNDQKFCSPKCVHKSISKTETRNCHRCGKEIRHRPSRFKKVRFCSDCRGVQGLAPGFAPQAVAAILADALSDPSRSVPPELSRQLEGMRRAMRKATA